MQTVFITGGTGYIGTRLIKALLATESYHIKTLTRKGSENKLPAGCEIIYGDALHAETYTSSIAPATVFVHLIGVPHPSPAKSAQFKKIDLVSVQQAAKAAATAGIKHFIYLSVAMYPTKISDKVVALGEAVATNKQTGKTSNNQWAMYWIFDNGKVTHYQNFSDTYDIAQSFIK